MELVKTMPKGQNIYYASYYSYIDLDCYYFVNTF